MSSSENLRKKVRMANLIIVPELFVMNARTNAASDQIKGSLIKLNFF